MGIRRFDSSDEVALLSGSRVEEVKGGAGRGGRVERAKMVVDPALRERPCEVHALRGRPRVQPEERGRETRVGEVDLRRLRESLPDVSPVRREGLGDEGRLQNREPSARRVVGKSRVPGQVRKVQDSGRRAGHEADESKEGGHVVGPDEQGNVSFEVHARELLVPLPPRDAGQAEYGFGESAQEHLLGKGGSRVGGGTERGVKIRHLSDAEQGGDRIPERPALPFRPRQRPEGDHRDPPRQRLPDPADRLGIRGSDEQEGSGRRAAIDVPLDGKEEIGGALDLVDRHGQAEPRDEPLRVRPRRGQGRQIVEADEGTAAATELGQRRLARLAGTSDKNGPEPPERPPDQGLRGPAQKRHATK